MAKRSSKAAEDAARNNYSFVGRGNKKCLHRQAYADGIVSGDSGSVLRVCPSCPADAENYGVVPV